MRQEEQEVEEPKHRFKPVDARRVHRFLHKWQWSWQSSNTKGAYLADDSVEMEETRMAHKAQRAIVGAPWELTLNYDQLWRSCYEAPQKVIHKRTCHEAKRQGDDWGEIRTSDIVGKRLQVALAITQSRMCERMGLTERPSKLRRTCPRTEFVVGGRASLTAVTSCWANGEVGPLGICAASGSLTTEFIRTFNADWRGQAFIFESGSDTHFMNADTTILYLQELIGPASWLECVLGLCGGQGGILGRLRFPRSNQDVTNFELNRRYSLVTNVYLSSFNLGKSKLNGRYSRNSSPCSYG